MPLHDYIKDVYESVNDPAYIVRFIDYLVSLNYTNPTFTVKNNTAIPLVMGVLENVKTKERYASFADFYSKVTGLSVDTKEFEFLRGITVTPAYSLWRVLCRFKEQDILGFYDTKYRTHLLYSDILSRVKQFTNIEGNSQINLVWGENKLILSPYMLTCKENSDVAIQFLEAYEDSVLSGVYYDDDGIRYLIVV
jgi:hypothetical protein